MWFTMTAGEDRHGIRIPRSAIRYALLQRPMLQRFTGLSRRFRLPPGLVLQANTTLRGRAIAASYSRMIRADFEMIRPHLPTGATRILDIGCGIGGLDVLLYRHYRTSPDLVISLLDRTDPHTIPKYGFLGTTEYYNALQASSAVLRLNDVPVDVFRTLDAAGGAFPEGPIDLVISIASWGFHYPLPVYLDRVDRVLAPDGRLILDVRRGQGQEELLADRFPELECIGSVWNGKAGRYRAAKNRRDAHGRARGC
jgi:SAM-dependent methyltransferase